MSDTLRNVLVLLALCALLFVTNIAGYDLWSPDEPRFGEVAREMMLSGDYLAPTINGEPYKEKPPLLFWAISLCSLPFGDVTEFSTRLPSILAASMTVLLTFFLARRMYGNRVAVWSGTILATCVLFWWEARTARTDMLLTSAMTASVVSLWYWDETRKTRWLVAFYAAIAAGGLAKGPPALIFPFALLIAFYWGRRDDRKRTHWIIGTLAVAAVVLAWFIPARMAISGEQAGQAADVMKGDLLRNIIGRAFMGVSKAQWPWYYLVQMPMTWFPWILFFPWAIRWVWQRRREDARMRFLLCAIVPAFVIFSIIIGKRTVYIMPLYPPMAILIARSVLDLVDERRVKWLKPMTMVLCAVLALAALAPAAMLFSEYKSLWTYELLAFSICAAGFAIDAFRRAFWTNGAGLHSATAGYFAGLVTVAVIIVLPLINPVKSARGICAPLQQLNAIGTDYKLYSLCFSREQYVFYARKFHTPVLTESLNVESALADSNALAAAKLQAGLRKAIMKAVENVPVADFANVQEAEIAALRLELDTAIAANKSSEAIARSFEQHLRAELEKFRLELSSPTPAFFFVQEEDWRWILPLEPTFRHLKVIREQQVGSRKVLLIANNAGAGLIKS
jgi:4-amino-4-deoxy-L-arabinose transferase-like glycosyltransferase